MTNENESAAQAQLEASSDRTPIYNAVARLREAFAQVTNNDTAAMQYFEQNALIIVTGTAFIADGRDSIIKELFKESFNAEKELDETNSTVSVDKVVSSEVELKPTDGSAQSTIYEMNAFRKAERRSNIQPGFAE